MFSLLPQGKSRPLSILALALAAFCGLMACETLAKLPVVLTMSASPSFMMGMAHTTVPREMPALAAFAADNLIVFFCLVSLLWLSGFTLALGVWRRLEWARRGAVAMLYLLSAAFFLTMLFPSLIVPRPLYYQGVQIAPQFNSVVERAAYWLRIVSLCGGSLLLWWGLLLDRGAARLEFPPGGKVKK